MEAAESAFWYLFSYGSSIKVGIPIKLRQFDTVKLRQFDYCASCICSSNWDLFPETLEYITAVKHASGWKQTFFERSAAKWWHFRLIVEQTYPGASGDSEPARPWSEPASRFADSLSLLQNEQTDFFLVFCSFIFKPPAEGGGSMPGSPGPQTIGFGVIFYGKTF